MQLLEWMKSSGVDKSQKKNNANNLELMAIRCTQYDAIGIQFINLHNTAV